MFKKDHILIGILTGSVLPLITFAFFELLKSQITLYLKDSFIQLLCIGTNALIFRYFIKKEKDQLAKGVLLATFIYAFIFFYLHFNSK